jgi:hypothetical protein
MVKTLKYCFVFFTLLFFSACEKIEHPYVKENKPCEVCDTNFVFSGNLQTTKNALIEEFTGHTCVNCPSGTAEIRNLQNIFGDKLISVGIHGGSTFAQPQNNINGKYKTDFRTQYGIDVEQYFQVNSIPVGMVNRMDYSSNHLKGKTLWNAAVQNVTSQNADVSLRHNIHYDEPSKSICINTEIKFIKQLNGNYNLIHYLVEDSIVDWQYNDHLLGDPAYGDGDVANYVHRHVLRAVYGNDLWGRNFAQGIVAAGTVFYDLSSFCTIKAIWNVQHLKVVSFVFDNQSKEIVQVIETKAFH